MVEDQDGIIARIRIIKRSTRQKEYPRLSSQNRERGICRANLKKGERIALSVSLPGYKKKCREEDGF